MLSLWGGTEEGGSDMVTFFDLLCANPSFDCDGVGIASIFALLVTFFVCAKYYRVYQRIAGGRLREHPLFRRDCYIYRDVSRPSIYAGRKRGMDSTIAQNERIPLAAAAESDVSRPPNERQRKFIAVSSIT